MSSNENINLISDEALQIGHLIAGRYKILRLLGSGGMGFVYLAADTLLGDEQVAVKVLHTGLLNDATQTARFLREVQLMRKVSHRNVVRTYDVGTDGKLVYFTMEYVAGTQLETVIGDTGIALDKIPIIILQICEGLKEIHAANIVHRDLKPANILMLEDGSLRITDFGVARPEVSDLTAHDEIVGSVCYMAPEIWLGQAPTIAVDFYSLGVIIYEMCTGNVPFDAESPAALMRLHLDRAPRSPRDLNSSVPPWLNKLVLRLLAKSPQERPQEAQEIIEFVRVHAQLVSQNSSANEAKATTTDFLSELEKKTQQTVQPLQLEHSEGLYTETSKSNKIRRRSLVGRGPSLASSKRKRSGLSEHTITSIVRRAGIAIFGVLLLTLILNYSAPASLKDISGLEDANLLTEKLQSIVDKGNWQAGKFILLTLFGSCLQASILLFFLGTIVASVEVGLRWFFAGILIFLVYQLAFGIYFLSTVSSLSHLSMLSIISALLASRDAALSISLLSPAIHQYQQYTLGNSLIQVSGKLSSINQSFFLLIAVFFFIVLVSNLFRQVVNKQARLNNIVLAVNMLAALMLFFQTLSISEEASHVWHKLGFFYMRLPVNLLYWPALNWGIFLVLAFFIARERRS